jgi:hypothetical protein
MPPSGVSSSSSSSSSIAPPNPQAVAAQTQAIRQAIVAKTLPKKPVSAYLMFVAEYRVKWAAANPNAKPTTTLITKEAGKQWNDLPQEQKQVAACYRACYAANRTELMCR